MNVLATFAIMLVMMAGCLVWMGVDWIAAKIRRHR